MSTQVAIAVPGKGFEIVPDEQTQRKFPAILTFDEHGDRLFGNSASSLVCFYRIAAIALFSDDTSMLFSQTLCPLFSLYASVMAGICLHVLKTM